MLIDAHNRMLWSIHVFRQEKQQSRQKQDEAEGRVLCVVCMERERASLFVPCGHLSCCGECALGQVVCPMCRAAVSSRHRAYLA